MESTPKKVESSGKQLINLTLQIIGAAFATFGTIIGTAYIFKVKGENLPILLIFAIFTHGLLSLYLCLLPIIKKRVTLKEIGAVKPSRRLLHLLWQIPLILTAGITTQSLFVAILTGDTSSSSQGSFIKETAASTHNLTLIILLFLTAAVIVPLWEEIYFRGYLMNWIQSKTGVFLTVLLTGLAFAIFHGVIILIPYYLVIGMCIAWLRIFHQNIWASILTHISFNSIIILSAILIMA